MMIKRQAIFWSALFLFIVGFILHIHQMFAMSASLACLPLIAWLAGRRKLRRLEVTRQLPQGVSAGEPAPVELHVRNTASTRRIFFSVVDEAPPALGGETHEFPVAILGPDEETVLSYELPTRRRGAYRLSPLILQSADAIGFRQFRRELPAADELLVYPRPEALPYAWPVVANARQPVRPRRRLRGVGDELYGVRDYVPGDDPRRIDWKTTARRGKLVVVEREAPESLQGMILLDLCRRWHGGREEQHTLEVGVTLAASLMEQAYERGSTVGLIAAGQMDYSCQSLPEVDQRLRLYEALARVQADGDAGLADVVMAHQELIAPQSALAIISPAPEGGALASYLRGLGHAVAWFVLDLNSFGLATSVDYGPLMSAVASARGEIRFIRGDRPLAANWLRGGGAYALGGF